MVAIAWAACDRHWVSACADGLVQLWNEHGKKVRSVLFNGAVPTAICVDEPNKQLLVGDNTGTPLPAVLA